MLNHFVKFISLSVMMGVAMVLIDDRISYFEDRISSLRSRIGGDQAYVGMPIKSFKTPSSLELKKEEAFNKPLSSKATSNSKKNVPYAKEDDEKGSIKSMSPPAMPASVKASVEARIKVLESRKNKFSVMYWVIGFVMFLHLGVWGYNMINIYVPSMAQSSHSHQPYYEKVANDPNIYPIGKALTSENKKYFEALHKRKKFKKEEVKKQTSSAKVIAFKTNQSASHHK